jgi:hypothetical protein
MYTRKLNPDPKMTLEECRARVEELLKEFDSNFSPSTYEGAILERDYSTALAFRDFYEFLDTGNPNFFTGYHFWSKSARHWESLALQATN